jgi:ParB family chromosome partitioning protein
MSTKKRLEAPKMRGVEDLLSMEVEQPSSMIPINQIQLPHKQPRRWFDQQKMMHLVESVRKYGILEPLLVRPIPEGKYELVAGERRLRAALEVGLTDVPIVSKELTDTEALAVALLENLQREDLNPVDETEGVLDLLAINLDITTEEVISVLNSAANAKKRNLELTENVSRQLEQIESVLAGLGKFNAESFRSSRLPLLNLPDNVLEALRSGKLEYTKARVIARVLDERQRAEFLERVITENLPLSQIKQLIKDLQSVSSTSEKTLSERYFDLSKRLKSAKVWDDSKKRKRLEKLLLELEQLLE